MNKKWWPFKDDYHNTLSARAKKLISFPLEYVIVYFLGYNCTGKSTREVALPWEQKVISKRNNTFIERTRPLYIVHYWRRLQKIPLLKALYGAFGFWNNITGSPLYFEVLLDGIFRWNSMLYFGFRYCFSSFVCRQDLSLFPLIN